MRIVKVDEGYIVEQGNERTLLAFSHTGLRGKVITRNQIFEYEDALKAVGKTKTGVAKRTAIDVDEFVNFLPSITGIPDDYDGGNVYNRTQSEALIYLTTFHHYLEEEPEDVLKYCLAALFPQTFYGLNVTQDSAYTALKFIKSTRFSETELGKYLIKLIPSLFGKLNTNENITSIPQDIYDLIEGKKKYIDGVRVERCGDMEVFICGNAIAGIRLNNIGIVNKSNCVIQNNSRHRAVDSTKLYHERDFMKLYPAPNIDWLLVDLDKPHIFAAKAPEHPDRIPIVKTENGIRADTDDFILLQTESAAMTIVKEHIISRLWAFPDTLVLSPLPMRTQKRYTFIDSATGSALTTYILMRDFECDGLFDDAERRAFEDIIESRDFYREFMADIIRTREVITFTRKI